MDPLFIFAVVFRVAAIPEGPSLRLHGHPLRGLQVGRYFLSSCSGCPVCLSYVIAVIYISSSLLRL